MARQLYPNLYKYLEYLKEAEKLNPEKILAEKESLESLIYVSLARSTDEQRLYQVAKSREVLRRLFNLSLASQDFAKLEQDPKSFDIVQMSGFLNKKIMDLASYYEDALFLDSGYDEAFAKAKEFYDLTRERDKVFVRNILQKMSDEKLGKSILVTGGYHTEHLKALLKEQKISYVSIIPQVLHETNMKRYEDILLNQISATHPLEINVGATRRVAPTSARSPENTANQTQSPSQWGVPPGAELFVKGERVKELLNKNLGVPPVDNQNVIGEILNPSLRGAERRSLPAGRQAISAKTANTYGARLAKRLPRGTRDLGNQAMRYLTNLDRLLLNTYKKRTYVIVRQIFNGHKRWQFGPRARVLSKKAVRLYGGENPSRTIAPGMLNVMAHRAFNDRSSIGTRVWISLFTEVPQIRDAWIRQRNVPILRFLLQHSDVPEVQRFLRDNGYGDRLPISSARPDEIFFALRRANGERALTEIVPFKAETQTAFAGSVREAVLIIKPSAASSDRTVEDIIERAREFGYEVAGLRVFNGTYFEDHPETLAALYQEAYEGYVSDRISPSVMRNVRQYYGRDDFEFFFGEPYSEDMVIPADRLRSQYELSQDEITELWKRARPDLPFAEAISRFGLDEDGIRVDGAHNEIILKKKGKTLSIPISLLGADRKSFVWFGRGLCFGLNRVGQSRNIFPICDPRINDGRPVLVMNGYVPGLLQMFRETPQTRSVAIVLRNSDGDSASWKQQREEFLGTNNDPRNEENPAGSIRCDSTFGQLPLPFSPQDQYLLNGQKNVAHVSAGPLEGTAEIINIFDRDRIEDTAFGRLLLQNGYSEAFIRFLVINPSVRILNTETGEYSAHSIFELTNKQEPSEALETIIKYFPPFEESDPVLSSSVGFSEFEQELRPGYGTVFDVANSSVPESDIGPAENSPTTFEEAAASMDVTLQELDEEGDEMVRRTQIAEVIPGGGTSGRFFGYKTKMPEWQKLKLLAPMWRIAGRVWNSVEVKILFLKSLIRKAVGGSIPVAVMGSGNNLGYLREQLAASQVGYPEADLLYYAQGEIPRLNPTEDDIRVTGAATSKDYTLPHGADAETNIRQWLADNGEVGDIFRNDDGTYSGKPPGHLDIIAKLVLSRRLLEIARRGVKVLHISNGDDAGATLDPAKAAYLMRRDDLDMISLLVEKNTDYTISADDTAFEAVKADNASAFENGPSEFKVVARGGKIIRHNLPPGVVPVLKGNVLSLQYKGQTIKDNIKGKSEKGGTFAHIKSRHHDIILDQPLPGENYAANQHYAKVSALLDLFGLTLEEYEQISQEDLAGKVRAVTRRMPTHIEIKPVNVGTKTLPDGTEAPITRPAAQFARYVGEITGLLRAEAVVIDRDGLKPDGSPGGREAYCAVKDPDSIRLNEPALRTVLDLDPETGDLTADSRILPEVIAEALEGRSGARLAELNVPPESALGKTESNPTPVLVLTVFDGNTLGSDGEITEKTRMLVGGRSGETNLTHPDVISTPTQRVPKSVLDDILRLSQQAEVTTQTELRFPERVSRVIALETPVYDSKESHNPVVYAVRSLLSAKLGLAEALEKNEVHFTATPVTSLVGSVLYAVLEGQTAAQFERHAVPVTIGGEQYMQEYHQMLNVRVVLDNPDLVPAGTPSYSNLYWMTVAQFNQMNQTRDLRHVSGISMEQAFGYCIHGLCLMTSSVYVNQQQKPREEGQTAEGARMADARTQKEQQNSERLLRAVQLADEGADRMLARSNYTGKELREFAESVGYQVKELKLIERYGSRDKVLSYLRAWEVLWYQTWGEEESPVPLFPDYATSLADRLGCFHGVLRKAGIGNSPSTSSGIGARLALEPGRGERGEGKGVNGAASATNRRTSLGMTNRSGVALSHLVETFFLNLAPYVSIKGVRLALAEEATPNIEEATPNIQVYTLAKDKNQLLVQTGRHRFVLDISTGARLAAHKSPAALQAKYSSNPMDNLQLILTANSLSGSPAAQTAAPAVYLIHLESFLSPGDPKAIEFQNLLIQQNSRLTDASAVVFLGTGDEIAKARGIVSDLRLSHTSQFISAEDLRANQDLRNAPRVLLIKQNQKAENLPISDSSPVYRLTLQANNNEDGRTPVFAFGAIQSLMELVARGQTQSAYDFFLRLVPENERAYYRENMGLEGFVQYLEGKTDVIDRFPLPATVWASLRAAQKLYQLARAISCNA